MGDSLSVAQIEQLLEDLETESLPQQREADERLQTLENGRDPRVVTHIQNFLVDPAYAERVAQEARDLAQRMSALSGQVRG